MNLKEKYSQSDLPPEHLDQLTSQLLTAKFDAEKARQYREALAKKGIERPVKTVRMKKRWPLLVAVAASFLLLLYAASFLWQSSPSSLQLAESHLEVPFPHTRDNKGQTDLSALRSEAIQAYEQSDFQKSAALRSELLALDETNEEDQFYLGLSSLYQDPPQLDVAIRQFQAILSSPAQQWQGEVQWFLALALIKAERQNEAKAVLQNIVATASWNKQKANKLLDTME